MIHGERNVWRTALRQKNMLGLNVAIDQLAM